MLRRNSKLGVFLEECCGVFLLLNKNCANSWSMWFQHFQGFTTSWSETLTHLSQCKLKQAGNKYFGLVRPKVLALVVVLALTCKFGQPRFFRTSPVRSIKYIYKQSWFREAQESFHFLFGLLDSLCRHKVATQCPNQQLKRVPDICRWASRVHRKSMFCCCIVGFSGYLLGISKTQISPRVAQFLLAGL